MSDMQGDAGEQRREGASPLGASNVPGYGGHGAPSGDTRQDAGGAGARDGAPSLGGQFQEQWPSQQGQQPYAQQQWQGQQPTQPQQAQQPWTPQQGKPRYDQPTQGGAPYGGPSQEQWQDGYQPGPRFGEGQPYRNGPADAQQFGQQAPGGPGPNMPWGGNQASAGGAKMNVRGEDGSPNLGLIAHAVGAVAQLFVILGSIGPWASIFGMSISGVRGDGKITLLLALVAIVLLALVILGKLPKVAAWGVVAISVINLFIGFADTSDYMAWGLLFVILFSFVGLASAVAGALLRDKGSAQKGGPGQFSPPRV